MRAGGPDRDTDKRRSKAPHRVTIGILLVWLTLSASAAASAADAGWKVHLKSGERAFKARKYELAQKELSAAVEALNEQPERKAELSKALALLGMTYWMTGAISDAEPVLKRSLEIGDTLAKQKDLVALQGLLGLGTIYRDQHRFSDAEALYKKALTNYGGKGPIQKLIEAVVLTALGTLYTSQERYQEAETSLRQALKARDSTFLKGYIAPGEILDPLGQALMYQAKYAEAEECFKQSVKLQEKKFGKGHPRTAFATGNLATLYQQVGRSKEAIGLFDGALAAIKSVHGPDSIQVAQLEANRALCLTAENRYAEAEEAFKSALAVHEKVLGRKHPKVAQDLINLADVYVRQGRYADAEPLLREALTIARDSAGGESETIHALIGLGSIYHDQQADDNAERYLKEALAASEALHGQIHDTNALILTKLGAVLCTQKRYADALPICRRALGICEKVFGADSDQVVPKLRDVAYVLEQLGEPNDAVPFRQRIIDIRRKRLGAKNADLVPDLDSLARLYIALGRGGDAEALQAEALALKKALPGWSDAASAQAAKPVLSAPPTLQTRSIRDKWALVIGISNFRHTAINLKYAAKDATDFRKYLVSSGRFAQDHVKLLVDKDATRERIVEVLGEGWLGKHAHKEDLVVVYISSHGTRAQGEAGGVNFLVAYDTNPGALLSTGIPMQWLTGIIKEQVKSDRVVLILDVCHSGAAATPGSAAEAPSLVASASSPGGKGLVRSTAFDVGKVEIGTGQAVICSSLPDQVSWESKNYQNSVFTRKLIESLTLRDANVSLSEAYDHLRKEVEAEVLRDRGQLQSPVLQVKSWQGGDPVLSVVPVVSEAGR